MSSDGKRIIAADQGALYGFDLIGVPDIVSKETITGASLFPTMISTPVHVKTTLPEIVPSKIVTTLRETTSTPKSEIPPFLTIIASAGLLFIVMRR